MQTLSNPERQLPVRRPETPDPDFEAFGRFIDFFCDAFGRSDLLAGVACEDSFKEYVPRYFSKLFGKGVRRMDKRHLKWFHRLEPVLRLPRGSTILDFGGGYGVDSIFLASLGYKVIFYEITINHIAICQRFKSLWEEQFAPLQLRSILASREGGEPFGHVDAVLFDEVAHHIEPVEIAFQKCADTLKPGGHVFLMEPNFMSLPTQAYFFKVRGFETVLTKRDEETGREYLYGNEHIRPSFTWNRIARRAGFELVSEHHVVPYVMESYDSMRGAVRALAEKLPVLRKALSSHITFHYRKAGAAGKN